MQRFSSHASSWKHSLTKPAENAEWLWPAESNWGSPRHVSIVTFKVKAKDPEASTALKGMQTVACVMSPPDPQRLQQCYASSSGRHPLEALTKLHAELEEAVGRTVQSGGIYAGMLTLGVAGVELKIITVDFDNYKLCTASEIVEKNEKKEAEVDTATAQGWVDCDIGAMD